MEERRLTRHLTSKHRQSHKWSSAVAPATVVDPHDVDADPDLTYHPDADSDADPDTDFIFDADLDADPTFHPDADSGPDPDPSFIKKAQTLEKVLKLAHIPFHIPYILD